MSDYKRSTNQKYFDFVVAAFQETREQLQCNDYVIYSANERNGIAYINLNVIFIEVKREIQMPEKYAKSQEIYTETKTSEY